MSCSPRNSFCLQFFALLLTAVFFSATATAQADGDKPKKKQTQASKQANAQADEMMYQPIEYVNKATPGPKLVVIPGEIKSTNVDFTTKVTPNNIADFAELELGQAGFDILERADLGPLLDELSLAANLGDAEGLKKFKKGKFETTQWLVKFDILKAEPVAAAKKGFKGGAIGGIAGSLIGGRGGSAVSTGVGSVNTESAAQVWIVGMRYKILDATTSEQVATGYKEQKMEIGAKSSSVLGIESGSENVTTLDTLNQRLVQECVVEIDANNK